MATLTVQKITRSGVQPSFASAAGGGDQFLNSGTEYLEIVNGSGGAITVTADIVQSVDSVDPGGKAISVPAGETRKFGPFPKALYNDSNGMVQITYSGVTSLTVGVFQLQ